VARFNGRFPDTLDDLLSLPGIGDYTANAIMAIAYDRPALPLDVNVSRILSRVLMLDIGSERERKIEKDFLHQVMISQSPRNITAALMELGQTICRRKDPRCNICPLAGQCAAVINHATLPINPKRDSKLDLRTEIAVVAICDGNILLCESKERLFAGMHLLPRLPFAGSLEQSVEAWSKQWKQSIKKSTLLPQVLHSYTRNRVTLLPVVLELSEPLPGLFDEASWIEIDDLQRMPMPSAHRKVLNNVGFITSKFK